MSEPEVHPKPYSKEDIERFRQSCKALKTYNEEDQTIHNSEYLGWIESMGIPTTEAQLEEYKAFYRKQRGDERIPTEEELAYLSQVHDPKTLILNVAKSFDKNGDGIISPEEFEAGMKALVAFDPQQYGEKGKITYADFLLQADTNKDGKIQIEELGDWLAKKN